LEDRLLLLAFLGVAVLAAPLAGGKLTRLATLRLRHAWLIALALGVQLVAFFGLPGGAEVSHAMVHVASYATALAFLVLNRSVPGMWLTAAGAAMNVAAIVANGGVMPAAPSALAKAGLPIVSETFRNTTALPAPRLAFLGDIFAVPASWPLHNVFSPGDVVLVLGVAVTIHRVAGSRLVPSGAGQFAPLLHRPTFMRLWSSQAISNLGDWTYSLAVAAILAERTHDPRQLALLLIVQMGPAAVTGFFLGPLADRHSRVGLMVGTDLVRAAAVASLLFVGDPSVLHIYAVAMCLGVFGAIFQPSLQASIPNVVDDAHLVAANSMVSATYYVAVMTGPALGGFLVGELGAEPVFALNALSFLASAALIAGIRLPSPRAHAELESSSAHRDLAEGARYALTVPIVRALLVVMAIVIVGAATKAPLESLFVLGTLELGPKALGLIAGSWGLGMVLGSFAAPALARRVSRERLFTISIGVVGVCIVAASRAGRLQPVLLAWLLAGAVNAVGDVAYDTLLQERTPDRIRGRVFAFAEAILSGGFLLGAFLAGWLGEALGIRTTYALSGALLLLAGFVGWAMIRSPWRQPPDAVRRAMPRPDREPV
jgi:MFS family permease